MVKHVAVIYKPIALVPSSKTDIPRVYTLFGNEIAPSFTLFHIYKKLQLSSPSRWMLNGNQILKSAYRQSFRTCVHQKI